MAIKRIFRKGGVDSRTGKARADHYANIHVSDQDVADQRERSSAVGSAIFSVATEETPSQPSAEAVALGKRMEAGVLYAGISADLDSSRGDYRVANGRVADDMNRAVDAQQKFLHMMNGIHAAGITPSPEEVEKLREIDANLRQLADIAENSGAGGAGRRPSDIQTSALELQGFYQLRAEVKSQVDGFLGDYSRSEARKTVDSFLDNSDAFTVPNPSDTYSFARDGSVVSSDTVLAGSLNDSLRSNPTPERFMNSLRVAAKLSDEGRDDLGVVVARNTLECRKDTPSLHGTEIPKEFVKSHAKLLTNSGIMSMK